MATAHLASWSVNLTYSQLPKDVIDAAIRTFYNWAGCAVGGSNHPTTTTAAKALEPFFGQPAASLLGVGKRSVDAQHAALLNGIASHVHDYDDTHLDTIIHPAGPVASALLAVAEWKGGIPGQDFLLALVCGIETECKVGLAVWPEHYDIGWHITSSTGSIGAAVAVSKLLSLSVEQTAHAIGIASTQIIGLREMFGSDTKSFHSRRAAQSGVLAAVLAQQGYTSSGQALEAKRGWANVVGATKEDVQVNLNRWLGLSAKDSQEQDDFGLAGGQSPGRWETLRNSFKPYPCGIVIHPVIDGCCQLHSEFNRLGLSSESIQQVQVTVHPLVMELTGKTAPRDGLEGKFSFYHGGAIGLLYGKATPDEYEDHIVQDPTVVAIRGRIQGTMDPKLRPDEAKIVLTMNDGVVLEKHVEHAVGSLNVPLDDEFLENKFQNQCAKVLANVDTASNACWNIAEVKDVSEIAKALST
ncbi:hypothetical protein PISL3812_06261 [Talaromyces islandicus]|uniref:Uncharacterized protein n=1 Tax=Talaromyces islandicus TaxID=28573 RepID=A0A0U1M0W6_TALIS|nr:hypothetical protein PISL3812_06261 [Talaromyces islandicus]